MALSKSESKKEVSNLACIARILLGPCTDTLRDVITHRITPWDFKIALKDIVTYGPDEFFIGLRILVHQYGASYSDFDIPLLYFFLLPVYRIYIPRPESWHISSEENRILFANIRRIYKMHKKYKYYQGDFLKDSAFEQDWEELFQTVKELEKYIRSATANQDAMKKIKNSSMDPDVEHLFISNLGESKIVFQHGMPPFSYSWRNIKTMLTSKKEAQVYASRSIEAYLERFVESSLHLEEALGNPAVDEGSGIMEELDSGQTKIMETGADDDGSHIKEELDNGKTNIIETGVFSEEIPWSKPEISEKLKDLLACFKVEVPEDPDPYRKSFVRHIIQDDIRRKLETSVQSLSKEIVLTKNISTKRHDVPTVEACVFEIDVVYDGDQFCATEKDASSNEFFNVNEDNFTRVILIKGNSLPVVDAKLIVYKKYEHVINKQKIILQHEYEEFDDVAKFIAYQILSLYCTFVESVITAFTMHLPKMISEYPVESLTVGKIEQICLRVFERIEDKDVLSMDCNRDWRRSLAAAIQTEMKKREAVVDNASLIYSICQRTVNDLNYILCEFETFRYSVHPADQNKQIKEWLKREVVRDRSVLKNHPSILKYITGYRDYFDKKQIVKVFLNCEDKESEMFFKSCCDLSKDLQFEFVNVEKFKEKTKEVKQLKLRESEAPAVDNITREKLKQIIQDHGEKIYGLFSNVVGINTSNVRRVSDSIKDEPCIVLYCLDKSLIPFGEKPLPEFIAEWPCDIREDFFKFGRCPRNCPAQNRSLPDTGCSIGIKSDGSSGSAGFLYKSKEPTNALGDGFFTAAHVAVKDLEKLNSNTSFRTANFCPDNNIIVHPSFPENGNVNYRVGRVVEAVLGKHLDFAAIKINERRNEAGKEILTFAEKGELKFGKDVVTKRGKATGTTYGYLINDTLSIKMEISPMTYKFYNCYTIKNINDDDPFFLEGDSGSGVYILKNEQPTKPLGIVFALPESHDVSAVCDISKIVETLGLQIVRFKSQNHLRH
ncbi:uncharacterized protein [Magallana gigas]|uniref:uncharacterized protein isoform X6 n=1 Tax=Magallana gigas TaxID=29159 RepID=UPI00333E875A